MNAGINCQKKRSVSIAQSTEHDGGIPMRMKRFKCVVLIGLLLFGWCGKVKASPVDSLRLFAETLEEHAAALDDPVAVSLNIFQLFQFRRDRRGIDLQGVRRPLRKNTEILW